MVGVTLRFNYPWNADESDENEVRDCLLELSPEELIVAANNSGEPINIDVEVYWWIWIILKNIYKLEKIA